MAVDDGRDCEDEVIRGKAEYSAARCPSPLALVTVHHTVHALSSKSWSSADESQPTYSSGSHVASSVRTFTNASWVIWSHVKPVVEGAGRVVGKASVPIAAQSSVALTPFVV